MRASDATYRLGAQFCDWGAIGERYLAGFGRIGAPIDAVPFQHYWLRAHRAGACAPFEDFSLAAQAARAGKFDLPRSDPRSAVPPYAYAWHFDSAASDYLPACARAEPGHQCHRRQLRRGRAGRGWHGDARCCWKTACASRPGCSWMWMAHWARVGSGPRRLGGMAALRSCVRAAVRSRCAPGHLSRAASAAAAGWRFTIPLQNSCVRGYVTSSDFGDERGGPHRRNRDTALRTAGARPAAGILDSQLHPASRPSPRPARGHGTAPGADRHHALAGAFSRRCLQPTGSRRIQPSRQSRNTTGCATCWCCTTTPRGATTRPSGGTAAR